MSRSPLAPQPLTMDRIGQKDQLILAQSTSQCCRCCCFQKSINFVVAEGDNFEPGMNPHNLDSSGWIHEESGLCHRWWSWLLPGCRTIKFVQHSGPIPPALMTENQDWCTCQCSQRPPGLESIDADANIVAIHEKNQTCGYCFNFGDYSFPICCCLPYLVTKDGETGQVLGKTQYICDWCCFVPKYDVTDATGQKLYRLRPDTCVCGLCVQCRCDGPKGKCCRVPFVVRNPQTKEPIVTGHSSHAQIDNLWTGWKHECCTQKDAYHVLFPIDASQEEKLILLGSTLLVDLTMFEQRQ